MSGVVVPDGWTQGFLVDFIDVNPTVKIDKNIIYPFIEMDAVPFDGKQANYVTYRFGSEAGMKFKYKDTLLARITPSAENGKSLYVLDNLEIGIGSTEFIVFRGKKIDSEFVFYLITSDYVRPKSIALMEGTSGRQRIPNNIYKDKIQILIPKEKKEQEKIAKILSTLDKNIENTSKIIEKEKNIKKALMQELLTNGIDKNNKIRSPKTHSYKQSKLGLIPEEWEVKKVCHLSKTFAGGTPNRENSNYYNGIIPWVKSGEVNQPIITKTEEAITQDGLNNSSAKFVEKGTILVAMYGATAGKIALLKIKATTNQAVLAVPLKNDDILFIINMLEQHMSKLVFQAQGSGQPNLSKQMVDSMLISVPPITEQKQIAKILNTQDKKIESEQKNLSKLQELKKGLMSDLLSGRVRVKV